MLPSHNEGIFARAMTTVEGKANGRAQGVFGSGVNEGQKQETSELAWAMPDFDKISFGYVQIHSTSLQ